MYLYTGNPSDMNAEDGIRSVEVFAGTYWEAVLVKSLLENAEVEAFLKNEAHGTLASWQVTPGGVAPVRVIVSSIDAEKATQVVRDFENNRKEAEDSDL